ncbi:MAG TPA: chemotaxis protein CheB [Balneolaceae bacterium]|nr:chemotaxis protein CheB [Balneolaceae bacterium]
MRDSKVYIIDQNVLVRHMVSNIIKQNSDGKIGIIGSSDGVFHQSVLNEIESKKPDVVLLGINERKSNEIKLFEKIRERSSSTPVIVMTPKNREGSEIAIDTLVNGAVEIVTKPENHSTILMASNHLKKRLLPILKLIPNLNTEIISRKKGKPAEKNSEKRFSFSVKRELNPVDIVIIAGCTGGVKALFDIFGAMPDELNVPVIVVQHLPGIITSHLADRLNKKSDLKIKEAESGDILKPGHVFISPGGYHTNIKNDGVEKRIYLHKGPREQRCRPSIDVVIRSARQVYGGNLLSVYLSGSGRDGILGAENIYSIGGHVIVQDRNSSLLWDLPGEVVSYGLSDGEYPVEYLGREIIKRVLKSKDSRLFESFKKKTTKPVTEADA